MKPSQSLVRAVVLAPVTAATTARTASIDCAGADYATILVPVGAELNTNSTNVALNLKEGDTETAWATFNSSYSVTLDNTAGAVETFNVDLKGRKRYLQITITPDTTTNGPVITSCISELVKENSGANAATVVVG